MQVNALYFCIESKNLMVDETGLDETAVDKIAVDEIADEPGPHYSYASCALLYFAVLIRRRMASGTCRFSRR